MPETFYLASRFSTLEQAGEAYFPIQEMLRADPTNNLSVFRFQQAGVDHVAVVGEEPPSPLRESIQHALNLGLPVALPQEVVRWLLDRRAQQAQPDTFREGHYTRETGPRPDRFRPRRGRVSTLEVTWQDGVPGRDAATGTITDLRTGELVAVIPSEYSGVCDWCTAELAPPVAAIHNFAVEMEFPGGFTTATGGKWATCSMCKARLKVKSGDSWVSFHLVDRLWRIHRSRYLGGDVRRLKVRTFYREGD